MTEPTMQVPVSLIEQARLVAELNGSSAVRDELDALLSQPTPTAEPPRIEDMAPGMTEEAIRADEREQWASYFDNADASVGSSPLTYARAVRVLRGPRPFGVAQGDPSTIHDVQPPAGA